MLTSFVCFQPGILMGGQCWAVQSRPHVLKRLQTTAHGEGQKSGSERPSAPLSSPKLSGDLLASRATPPPLNNLFTADRRRLGHFLVCPYLFSFRFFIVFFQPLRRSSFLSPFIVHQACQQQLRIWSTSATSALTQRRHLDLVSDIKHAPHHGCTASPVHSVRSACASSRQ